MPSYEKKEARDWARARLRGCANAILASYTRDLSALDEAGIRHDVRRELELGFSGALLVSETALTHRWQANVAGLVRAQHGRPEPRVG